jgi:hypothetical protein
MGKAIAVSALDFHYPYLASSEKKSTEKDNIHEWAIEKLIIMYRKAKTPLDKQIVIKLKKMYCKL